MTNDKDIHDKLEYFFKEKTKVFFRLKSGLFRKGFIDGLNEKYKTVVIIEDVLGKIALLFNEIDFNSITFTKEERI